MWVMECETLDTVVRVSCLAHTAYTDLVHFIWGERLSFSVQGGTHLELVSKLSAYLFWGAQSGLPDFLAYSVLLRCCCGGFWTFLGVDVHFRQAYRTDLVVGSPGLSLVW